MNAPERSGLRLVAAAPVLLVVVLASACKEKEQPTPPVTPPDAAPVTSTEPKQVDLSTCVGCQNPVLPAWSFQGVYRDERCTVPVAQIAVPACAQVPQVGEATVTFAEGVGARKAGESSTVTLTEVVAPNAARFRKAGARDCVRLDESAVDLTPAACAGQQVCRDDLGGLSCSACRKLENGCPDYEETRMYAVFDDKGAKPAGGGGGGGNLARLRQCCAALAAEARRLGASPEAGVLNTAAAQCNALVTAAGPSGNAPELGALRTILAGRPVPAICAGF